MATDDSPPTFSLISARISATANALVGTESSLFGTFCHCPDPKSGYKGQSKQELEAAREIGAAKEDSRAEELMRKVVQTAGRLDARSLMNCPPAVVSGSTPRPQVPEWQNPLERC